MNVFVTGATGFIGRHLVRRLLARGDAVTCYARPSSRAEQLTRLPVRCVLGQLHDAEALQQAVRGAELVVHVAGASYVRHREEFYAVNQQGTAAVAAACARQSTPPRLLALSSLAAAGPATPDRPRIESDPCRPVSHYGKSKLAGEVALHEHAGALPISIVRPPIVFGPEDPQFLQMFQAVRTRLHLVPTWQRTRFSLIHVSDLIECLLLVAAGGESLDESKPGCGIYYATSPERPSLLELGDWLAEAMAIGRPWKVPLPAPIAFVAAAIGEAVIWYSGEPWAVNWDKMREATAGSWWCSGDKAARQLGFQVKVPLQERLRSTADWYRAQGKW